MVRLSSVLRGAAVAAIGITSLASSTLAEDTVTQEITEGTLSASVADADMVDIAYSNAAGSTTGTLNLNVDDARGTATGWNVTIASSAFIYDDTSPIGIDIPNTGFSTTGYGPLTVEGGQSIPAPTTETVGLLSGALPVFEAAAGSGSGEYTQPINVLLLIPAASQSGTYLATLIVTVSDGATP